MNEPPVSTRHRESQRLPRRAADARGIRREIALTSVAASITVLASALAVWDILLVLFDRVRAGSWAYTLGQVLFLTIVGFLIYGALVYHFTRLGYFKRLLAHRPAPDEELIRIYQEHPAPALTILVPSYKEDEQVVRKTLLSAALQEYPNRRIVLLIDDPPHPTDPQDVQRLSAARRLPEDIHALLRNVRRQCESALEAFLERKAMGKLTLHDEASRLAQLHRDVAAWFEGQADRHGILDHVDHLFAELTFLEPARRYRRKSEEWADVKTAAARCHGEHDLAVEYRRLAALFQVDLETFERKRYVNLSHAPNKAMNLNSYIGLMGKSFRQAAWEGGMLLQSADPSDAEFSVPEAEYVLMVDADSVLSPDYALRLVHLLRQPEHERVAVAQTPYSAFPGAPGVIERIAGATTDIQYLIHQGFTYYGATFWVGANAVVRKSALEDIAEHDGERGYPITKFIQDRTVIEGTESSVDLIGRNWQLYNYPERLAFSATPPDFGSLLIQRRRWANGGLIILPKLLRYLCRNASRAGIVREGLMRCHYLTSITAVNIGLLVVLALSFEHSIKGFWLPLTALPYYALYMRDLQRAGYRAKDLLRAYALNLMLIPVNLAGVARSVSQAWTGHKAAFGRTPKMKGRMTAPPPYLLAEYALLVHWVLGALVDLLHGRTVHAVFALVNAAFLYYAVSRFIGVRESWEDLRLAWRRAPFALGGAGQWTTRVAWWPRRQAAADRRGLVRVAGVED